MNGMESIHLSSMNDMIGMSMSFASYSQNYYMDVNVWIDSIFDCSLQYVCSIISIKSIEIILELYDEISVSVSNGLFSFITYASIFMAQ